MLAQFWWALCLPVSGLAASIIVPRNSSILDATKASITALNTFYDSKTGRWDPNGNWWHSALALQGILDYTRTTGSAEYLAQAQNTIDIQRAPLPWWPDGKGDFRADSTDDTGWWALALLTMYELTGNTTYLDIAKEDEAYMYMYWTPSTCNGGLIWDIKTRSYKNAISNELYFELTAGLHNLIPGDSLYLTRSLTEWEWFKSSGMINSQWLINDGLLEPQSNGSTCGNNNGNTWTYNQGVILGGLVELSKATGDQQYLNTARNIADAVINSPTLSPGGTLTEICTTTDPCDINGWAFKGIFMNRLAKLNRALSGHPYSSYIRKNAQTMYANARNGSDFYGGVWQNPFDGPNLGKQDSAVWLLVATLGLS